MTEHSPTPWELEAGRCFITPSGKFHITYGKDRFGNPGWQASFAELDENARFILTAVNAHAALVAACDAALTHWHSKPSNFNKHEPAYLQMCRDALALAKENTK